MAYKHDFVDEPEWMWILPTQILEDRIEEGWEMSVNLCRCTVGPRRRPSFIRINPVTMGTIRRARGIVESR